MAAPFQTDSGTPNMDFLVTPSTRAPVVACAILLARQTHANFYQTK